MAGSGRLCRRLSRGCADRRRDARVWRFARAEQLRSVPASRWRAVGALGRCPAAGPPPPPRPRARARGPVARWACAAEEPIGACVVELGMIRAAAPLRRRHRRGSGVARRRPAPGARSAGCRASTRGCPAGPARGWAEGWAEAAQPHPPPVRPTSPVAGDAAFAPAEACCCAAVRGSHATVTAVTLPVTTRLVTRARRRRRQPGNDSPSLAAHAACAARAGALRRRGGVATRAVALLGACNRRVGPQQGRKAR